MVISPNPPLQPNGSSPQGDPLVSIRIKSDERGRFGFNVKGGADQGSPIIVSRVARNTPVSTRKLFAFFKIVHEKFKK